MAFRAWLRRSRAGLIGAAIGGAAGFLFGFGVPGIVLGPFFGAVLAELMTGDRKDAAGAFGRGFIAYVVFALFALAAAGLVSLFL